MASTGLQKIVEVTWELLTLGREFMSFSSIQSRKTGHLLQVGLNALTLQMTSHVKFIRNYTWRKIWEIHGSILKTMSLILLGEQLAFQAHWKVKQTTSREFSLLMIQSSRATKRQALDGSRVSIFTSLMTFWKLRNKFLKQEIASLWPTTTCSLQRQFLRTTSKSMFRGLNLASWSSTRLECQETITLLTISLWWILLKRQCFYMFQIIRWTIQ